jgi:hypothetical protein
VVGGWTPPERDIREQNRIRLLNALGEKLFQQSFVAGQQLTCEQMADLALGRLKQLTSAGPPHVMAAS